FETFRCLLKLLILLPKWLISEHFTLPLTYLILPVHTPATHSFPSKKLSAAPFTTPGRREVCPVRMHQPPLAGGRIALNTSCDRGQCGVLNWHLQQAWRLAPVSRSICCTAIRLHLCIRQTCVS
uniref:Uncharacterized protein n=1 Tax=Seriola dumerili TaxID=41447 RepID=A0A3B4TUA8_SERDU